MTKLFRCEMKDSQSLKKHKKLQREKSVWKIRHDSAKPLG